ncbi:MAG: tetratricopeptide repeat protein [Cyclobacteriaceae bacterium]
MRILFFTLMLLVHGFNSFSQSSADVIADGACDCIEIANIDKIDSCITNSMTKFIMANKGSDDAKFIGTVEGIRKAMSDSYNLLQQNCESFRQKLIEARTQYFYKESESIDANNHYSAGIQMHQNKEYKSAIKEYKKALKVDPNYVFALDNLAVCYRLLESYDKAIEYYKKSLSIFPEGNFALQNIAAVYGFKNDSKTAIEYYNKLINIYPNDPEGYYGVATEALIIEDFELACETAMISLILYKNSLSSHTVDSEKLLSLIYAKLQQSGQTDIFDNKAKELNIETDLN